MKVEVLLSTMNQTDMAIIDKCRITGNVVVINQCLNNKMELINDGSRIIKFISSNERGLSKSRNKAIDNSEADICILCDDDIEYLDGYEEIVIEAFKKVPDADVIVFNIISMNPDKRKQEKLFKKIKRIPFFKTYSSVHIAFKRESIVQNKIRFNDRFGSGSKEYSFAEDSLFFNRIHQLKLKSYVYPAIIANLYTEGSSWFKGFDKKYFFDTGAYLAAAHSKLKRLYMWYYPLRINTKSEIGVLSMIRWINRGIKGYGMGLSYEKYCEKKTRKDNTK